jgi:DNA-directed RNA polymerase specialized sigma24 family protein
MQPPPHRDAAPPEDRESAYELFRRGSRLLESHHPGPASVILERALALEPGKASILEALGRAYFNSGQPEPARSTFERVLELDPELGDTLRSLSPTDREALLLVAWEDLTPTQAARSLGIRPAAFRVRLLRARRRLRSRLEEAAAAQVPEPKANLDMETT